MSEPLASLSAGIGQTCRSDWLLIDQKIIDRFADFTRDRQFIHVDPDRASSTSFGGTVAHGFLFLSLLPSMQEAAKGLKVPNMEIGVDYGFDRVRFISPKRSGSRIRVASTLHSVDEKKRLFFQVTHEVTVEIDGGNKPALQATWISQLFF